MSKNIEIETDNLGILKVIGRLFLILVSLVVLYLVYVSWSYWFPNITKVKQDCYVENIITQNPANVIQYADCLKNHNVAIEDADIRKQCSIKAQDEYRSAPFRDLPQNTYYLNCIHSEGLAQ